MKSHVAFTLWSTLLVAAFGCAQSDFSGKSGKSANAPAQPQLTGDSSKAGDGSTNGNGTTGNGKDGGSDAADGADITGSGVTGDPSGTGGGSGSTGDAASIAADDAAVAKCEVAWGKDNPFPKGAHYRTIDGSKTSLGILDVVWDQGATDKPEIVLVHSKFGLIGAGLYNLQNPNGWYCLNVEFGSGGLASGISTVNLTCDAHLVQAKYTGAAFSKIATVVRMNMMPPMPCLDGKDHLVKIDASSSVLGNANATILLQDEAEMP